MRNNKVLNSITTGSKFCSAKKKNNKNKSEPRIKLKKPKIETTMGNAKEDFADFQKEEKSFTKTAFLSHFVLTGPGW